MTRKIYRMRDNDIQEEDGSYTIYLPSVIEHIPADLSISNDGVVWNCYLVKTRLGFFYPCEKSIQKTEMYKCTYKAY